jgi:hypothetical protein
VPHIRWTAPGKFAVAANAALFVDGDDCVVGGCGGHGCVVLKINIARLEALRAHIARLEAIRASIPLG